MSGVQQAYATGRGMVYLRARADIEKLKNGRENIVVTEIPFLVNKSTLLEKIADLVRDKTIEGLRIALNNIDAVIETIRASSNPEEARDRLMEQFALSERQAQAILSMPLQRLTGLERDKIEDEYKELTTTIEDLKGILASQARQMQIIKDEIGQVTERFGEERRTEIVYGAEEFDIEDLIAEEDMVVTISREDYVKRLSLKAYRVQNRGGRGVTGHEDQGGVFRRAPFRGIDALLYHVPQLQGQVPLAQGLSYSRGRPIVNSVPLDQDDKICAIVPVREFSDDEYLFTATRNGNVEKTMLSVYQNIRRDGIIALKIQDDDDLIGAAVTDGRQDISLSTRTGQALRFNEDEVRSMGRVSTGV